MSSYRNQNKIYMGILIGFIAVMSIVAVSVLFIYPPIFESQCKTRVNTDLENKMGLDVLSANICIVQFRQTQIDSSTVENSYSAGASGIIFEKDENKYYALTAYHVVSEMNEVQFIVQPYGSSTYEQAQKNSAKGVSLIDYYRQFPTARVEYWDESYDLAIISFTSNKELGVLPISGGTAEKKQPVAVISNPEGQRFVKTYGEITSDSIVEFHAESGKISNMVFCHNAYVAPGSSGSAVLNDKMEILGINIGGGTNFKNYFQYGAMIPCQHIRYFIGESKKYIK